MTRASHLRVTLLGCLVAALAAASHGAAAIKEIEAAGRYNLGDNDTRLDGRRLALLEAKRNALEKAGTYVESITEVKDFQLTRDDIRTYTAGIVEVTEAGEPKWEMIGDTLRCTVTVKVRVDQEVMTKKIAALRQDKEATRELQESRAKTIENEKKIAELNRQLKSAKKGSEAAKKAKESRDNALAGIDSATLRAQAAAAAAFSKESWNSVRTYINRNVDLHGCMPFKTKQAAAARPADLGLLVAAAPACLLGAHRLRAPKRGRRGPR